MSVNLQLKKFDMSSINDGSIMTVIGKRNTGKSFLVKDLLYYHQDIPVSCVISPTERANGNYGSIIPKIFIHDEYTPEILDNFMKRQKKLKKRMTHEPDIDNRACLILDDCLYDNAWIKDKNIKEIYMNGRHWGIFYILTMQHPLGIPPMLRTQIDYTIILRENLQSNRKKIYEHYAGMFPTYELFCVIMDQLTENYGAVVIHNGSHSNKIEDQVFWYKAEDHGDFRLGPDAIWDYCEQELDSDSESDDEIDINSYHKKNRPVINIKKL